MKWKREEKKKQQLPFANRVQKEVLVIKKTILIQIISTKSKIQV